MIMSNPLQHDDTLYSKDFRDIITLISIHRQKDTMMVYDTKFGKITNKYDADPFLCLKKIPQVK